MSFYIPNLCDLEEKNPMTNADRMNAMSIKEKAQFLTSVVADGCPPAHDWDCMKDEQGWEGCDDCWEMWQDRCDHMVVRVTNIMNVPAADVAEVVRCGECERRDKSADLTDTVYCPWLKLQMRKTDFCSYGERKDNNV